MGAKKQRKLKDKVGTANAAKVDAVVLKVRVRGPPARGRPVWRRVPASLLGIVMILIILMNKMIKIVTIIVMMVMIMMIITIMIIMMVEGWRGGQE